jgi:hypothetical protein
MKSVTAKPIKVSGKIGRKSQITVEIDGRAFEFTSVSQAVLTFLSACSKVYEWAENEYQAEKTNRRFKDSNC